MSSHHKIHHPAGLHVIAYPAMLDVPRTLVTHVARLLADERRARGTRRNSRALTCGKQALFAVVWFRKREDIAVLGAGFGRCRVRYQPSHGLPLPRRGRHRTGRAGSGSARSPATSQNRGHGIRDSRREDLLRRPL
jgi:hypothetical protein